MITDKPAVSEYASYLTLGEVLAAQRPRSESPDEMLFIVAHQVHELWFKLLLHELAELQRRLADDDTAGVQQALGRSLRILDLVVSPINVLSTLTPHQFSTFRHKLGNGSGFQSAQFREIEAALGRRDPRMYQYFSEDSDERNRIRAAMLRPSVFDSFLAYLSRQGHPVPAASLRHDVTEPREPSPELQEALLAIYQRDGLTAQICDRLADLDQALQEWRYRHVTLVAKTIGERPGTGGSAGAAYLRSTLFRPMFPDLWAARSLL
nr:tryptophan 2,3-dioxygenase family protein [Micromonospora sp. DSM 115978]